MLDAAQTTTEDTLGFAHLLQEALDRPGILSEAYRAFHRYSLGNQLLAAVQLCQRGQPLSPIASFGTWRQRSRWVKKGEKALALWMPLTCRCEKDETKEVTVFTRFALRRNWFALEQTDGEPHAPELRTPTWDPRLALETLAIREVPFTSLEGNIQGYAEGRTLAINPLAPLKHKTRFHELAHIFLGHTEGTEVRDTERLPRALAEVEAEGTAYVLCALLGLPGLEEARGYLQQWLGSAPFLEANGRRILVAADSILKAGAPRAAEPNG
jgi:hypothetical protein